MWNTQRFVTNIQTSYSQVHTVSNHSQWVICVKDQERPGEGYGGIGLMQDWHIGRLWPAFAFVRGELTKGGRIAKVAEALVTKKQGLKWSKWPDCKSRARCWQRSNFTILGLLVFNMHYMGPLWGFWFKQKRQTCQQRQVLFRAVNGCFGAELYVQCTKPDKESSRPISHSPKFKTKFIVPLFSQTYNSSCKKCKCQYIIGEQQHFHSPQRKLMLRLFSSA